MRPIYQVISATGKSPWVSVNQLAISFGIGLCVSLSSGSTITYTVEHTFDETGPDGRKNCSVTRSGTTATLKYVDHGLSVGDSIQVINTDSSNLDGTYDVASVVDANTITYTVANSGATADTGNAKFSGFRVFPHSVLATQSASKDGNYAFPVSAVRLNATVTSGKATFIVLQGMGR